MSPIEQVVCAGSKFDILLSSHISGCDNHTSMLAQAFEKRSVPEKVVPLKRRLRALSRSNMPVQTSSPPLPASFPSFMSVFGGMSSALRAGRREEGVATHPLGRTSPVAVSTAKPSLPLPHRQSISSEASESTDSSPTSTISTFDSPTGTDTSPSSSPDSPSSMPLPCPKFMSPADSNADKQSQPVSQSAPTQPGPNASIPARSESPGRRARNLKNLSVKVPPPSSSRPTIATASVMETTSSHNLSAPPSPIKAPVKPARRKPANLTIRTPRLEKSFFSNDPTDMVPPTPRIRSLRHIESSPSLPSICSPSTAPPGGMQLPRPSTQHGTGTTRGAWQDDSSSQVISRKEVLHDLEEEDDHLYSRESTKKPERGYPDGPIRIYDSGVYLYLEPTKEEASRFDVVVNVAKEVANPFTKSSAKNNTVVSTLRSASSDSKRQSGAEPETAMSDASFKSALECLPAEEDTPTNAKVDRPGPEYIHVCWDHNSEILDDLYPLCELIDDRVSKGKTVLVHCQLGVSRSASLVIAYGLYKNHHLDFNAMYGIVKGRSCWVGPNMSLIYQLTDFRARVLRGGPSKPPPAEWFVSGGSKQTTESPQPIQDASKQSVATEPGSGTDSQGGRLGHSAKPSRTLDVPTSTASERRSVSPRPLPLREGYHAVDTPHNQPENESNIRKTEFVRHPSMHMDLFMKDLPPTPSLFSPRAAGFMAKPFSRTLAGDLAGDVPYSPFRFGQDEADPRSPPQGNEPIMRNIDGFL